MMAQSSVVVRSLLVAVFFGVTCAAGARPLTLTPVGSPIPGVGPVGVAVAQTSGGNYALIGDYQGNTVRNLRLDPATGALTPVGSVPVSDGPSAIAVAAKALYAVVSNQRSDTVTSLRIDPATGALTPVGSVPSGGRGPTSIAINNNGFVAVGNRDSNNVGVLQLDPATGVLRPIGSASVGTAPATVKMSGNIVAVGHAVSNDVHLLRLDRFGALSPIDTRSIGSRITSIEMDATPGLETRGAQATRPSIERRVVALTYPAGDAHLLVANGSGLALQYSRPTGSDVISSAVQGTELFVTGAQPPRLTVFDLTPSLPQIATVALSGLSSRTIATVPGPNNSIFVIVNEYNNNQTRSFRAAPP